MAPGEGQIRERLSPGRGMKGWDKAFYAVYITSIFALLALAPLDAGRFHWSPEIPLWLYAAAYAASGAGLAWSAWARKVNRFFSSVARIQKDRGQCVVTGGPYRYMRHPGYAGFIPLLFALPIMLGSYVALIPAAATLPALLARTYLEDGMLKKELKGYKEYCKKVKYRLIPGVW